MANIIDLLLEMDEAKIERPSKEVEITRLSKLVGEPFKVLCTAISTAKFEDIQTSAFKKKEVDVNLMQSLIIIEGVCDLDGKPLFKNKDLQSKFGVHTPKDLVKKLLLTGEITKLYTFISDLSGFGEDSVIEEIKN